jgi:hypothetical protein
MSDIIANFTVIDVVNQNSVQDLVDFVIALEKKVGKMDFTEQLYQHFRKIMEKEMPENL